MPAKSKHMERRKQRIANAKKNARLAAKLRRRRQLQATFGLLAVIVLLTAAYLWQSGFFESEEPADDPAVTETPSFEPTPTTEPTDGVTEAPTDEAATPTADSETE